MITCSLLFASSAEELAQRARQAEKEGNYTQAYLLYSQAAALEPQNTIYWLRSQAVRYRAAMQSPPTLDVAPDQTRTSEEPDLKLPLDIFGKVTPEIEKEARQPLPPLKLQPLPVKHSFKLRGTARELWTELASSFGLQVVFDSDYPEKGPEIDFSFETADFDTAKRALEELTASFAAPFGAKLILVAKDTLQKRRELEPTITVLIPIPEPVSLEEVTWLTQAARQTFESRQFFVDTTRRMVVLRDTYSKVLPAKFLLEQMLRHRPEVEVEVKLIEVAKFRLLSYGILTQTRFPIAYFGGAFNSPVQGTAGFTRFLAFGGGKALLGLGVADLSLFAQLTRSDSRTLFAAKVRSVHGQKASMRVGDRFPIPTAGFFGTFEIEGQVFRPPPTFSYEDLGFVLDVTPYVHDRQEVTLEVDASFRLLTGQTINELPVISNRQITCTVRLQQGQVALVSGLMSVNEARTISGLAGLSRLPVIGPLFRRTGHTEEDREVLLLIRPVLVALPPSEFVTRAIPVGSETRPRAPL